MSDEIFEDSITKCNERYGFIPQFSMKNLQLRLQGSEREQRLKQRLYEKKQRVHEIEKQLKCHIKEISQNHYMINYQKKQIDENNKLIKDQQNRLDDYHKQIKILSKKISISNDEWLSSMNIIEKQEIKLQENESTIKLQKNRLRELEDIIRDK